MTESIRQKIEEQAALEAEYFSAIQFPPTWIQTSIKDLKQDVNAARRKRCRDDHQWGFIKGAAAMHSLMLEELKPIVEKLENIERGFSLKEPRMDYGGYQMAQMASQALEIFKRRIEVKDDNR